MSSSKTSQCFQEMEIILKESFSCSKALAEDLQDDESEKCQQYVQEVQESVLQVAAICYKLEALKECTAFVDESCDAYSELQDPDDLQEMLSTKLAGTYESSRTRSDPKCHPMYAEFLQSLGDGGKIVGQGSSSSYKDDDLVVDRVQKSLYCPLTKKLLEKPVTSTKCNHSFSYEAIQQHIKKRSSPKCPVCNEAIASVDLVPDNVLRRMVKKKKRENNSLTDSNHSRFVQL